MLPYVLKRLALSVPFLWLLASLVFLLSRSLPGNFGEERILQQDSYYSKGSNSSRQQVYQDYLQRTGLNLPLFYFSLAEPSVSQAVEVTEQIGLDYRFFLPNLQWHGTLNQYHNWLTNLVKGNLGTSYKNGDAVSNILLNRIGNTFLILLISMALASVVALEVSVHLAQQRRQLSRKLILPSLFVLDSVPMFVLALLLLVLFASPAFLQLFPVYGLGYYGSMGSNWWQQLAGKFPYMVLPILCLTLANLPYLTTQIYRSVTDTLLADFSRTAKAKGLQEKKVIRKHVLPNALLPVITLLTDFLPALVAGAVIIETIFAIPGMGSLLIDSILARDYPVIVGIVLVIATIKVLAHLTSDVLYQMADPRLNLNG
ncbi:ABC transporter permease [Pontibacter harenae]|uniref:ABC transporter permease n=1 Tax=Pontibacter harenae TaxID=2894083 RepID=UPI001E2A7C65|nr:ABC transporter permease [Pontibacter harenae]MCC9167933.1 ABC transporter permease [Pontibacter harenae]